ncbi:hypothetical protein GCM10023187_08570 [Nibrella viscosa]|uniref:YbbR-like protein n=1 Tax=Nibrella viscosa TaxID=1084524 RepID=A0ABP8JZ49_9BACT
MAKAIPTSRPIRLTKILVSLLAAALFWIMNSLNRDYHSLNIEYPIRFLYNDSLYVPVSPLPQTITVNVSGVGWELLGHSLLPLQAKPVDYYVRNPLRASAINTSSLTAALAEQIKDVRVNYVLADTLDLNFDRRLSKPIRIMVDSARIDMAPRFVITSIINVTPSHIQVDGPERLVSGLPDTLRLMIPRKRIADNYDEELPVSAFQHPRLNASTNRVFVSFEVAELLSPQPPVSDQIQRVAAPAPTRQETGRSAIRTNRARNRPNRDR